MTVTIERVVEKWVGNVGNQRMPTVVGVEIVVDRNVSVVDSPTGRPLAARRGRTGGLLAGGPVVRKAPLEVVEHVGIHGADHFGSETRRAGPAERRQRRPRNDEEKTETKQKTTTGGKQMGEGSWGEEGIGGTACAWVHLYGGATRRVVKKLAGAPIW